VDTKVNTKLPFMSEARFIQDNMRKLTTNRIALGTHLFVKVHRPEDSEGTFSVFQVKLPPVTTSQTTQR